MAAKTSADKPSDTPSIATTLNQRLDALQVDVRAAATGNAETAKSLAEIKTTVALLGQQLVALEHLKQQPGEVATLKTEIALLKREVDEIRKWQEETKRQKEEWGRKAWLLIPPVLAAVLTALLSGLINYLAHK